MRHNGPMPHPVQPPTVREIAAAHARITGRVHRTPVLTSRLLDAAVGRGAHLHLKAENLQRIGAFKIRGAMNALAQMSAEQRERGVIAYSSGNHAQAVALAAAEHDAPAVVVMPANAPAPKRAATAAYGAEVVQYDPVRDSREEIAARIAEERGAVLLPPFDHPDVIAGQGTAARELLQDVPDLDVLLVPVGGGGLLAGTLLAAQELRPELRVIGVEPEAGDDVQRSLAAGRPIAIDLPDTIADGARTRQVGELTFPIIREHAWDILTVPDTALLRAMRFAASRLKTVIEPTGALGLAAAIEGARGLRGQFDAAGQRVGVILSGGNADLALLADPRGEGRGTSGREGGA